MHERLLIPNRRLSRRAMLRGLASLGLGVAVMSKMPGKAFASDKLSFYTWSTYEDPKLYPEYKEKHGKPDVSFFGDTDEAFAKITGGYKVDLAHPCADDIIRWRNSEALKPFDESKITTLKDFWPELMSLPGTVDEQGKRWFIPFDWGNTSIAYRTDLVDAKDPSWKLLYDDDRYKGRVAFYDSGPPAVEMAAAILGYPDIFNISDDQLVECAKLLRKQRDNTKFFWSTQAEIEQSLASGEIVAAYAWNDAVARLKKQGVPIGYMNPKEGMRTWVCGLVMPKDIEHEDLAYEFINSFTSAESGKYLVSELGTGHVNKKAFDMVDPKVLDDLGIANPTEVMSKTIFLRAVPEERRKKYVDLFNTIKAGG